MKQYQLLFIFSCFVLIYLFFNNFDQLFESGLFTNGTTTSQAKIKAKINHFKVNFEYMSTKLFESHSLDCSMIINGNLAEIRRAERYMDPKSDKIIANFTNYFSRFDCTDFFYPVDFSNGEERGKQFPLAYSIIVYKNPRQFLKLFRTIYRPWNFYCIHVDAKAKIFDYLTFKLKSCFPGRFFVSPIRENVRWGEMSLLRAALSCFKVLLNGETDWKYLINIAGTDFPLKTNEELVEILRDMNPTSDVQNLGPVDSWKYVYSFPGGLSKETLDEFRTALRNKLPYPTKSPFVFPVVKGSFSGSLSRSFVDFLLNDKLSGKFLVYLEDTFIPDEAYWPSLYHNYFIKLMPNNHVENVTRHGITFRTRYTHWGDRKPLCSGYTEHGLCVFGIRDLKWIVNMDAFFAHKFDYTTQPFALNCLEEYIFNKTFFLGKQ